MIMNKKYIYIILILFCAIFVFSCAAGLQGPLFKPVSEIPKDKSIIYIYRINDKINTEFIINYFDKELCVLQNNGYFPYIIDQGKVELTSKVQFKMFATGILDQAIANPTQLIFEAQAGKTYYIECKADELGGQELSINKVPDKYGRNRIKECKLLDPFTQDK
jgi:hypothetical protein